MVFILKINYLKDTDIKFLGPSNHKIFDFINKECLQWQKFLQQKAILHRLKIC